MQENQEPRILDVLEAKKTLSKYLPRTPLYFNARLSSLLEAQVYVKYENFLPTSAFKVRGGINLIAGLPAREMERGVITASTGNHAQSIAYASKLFGVKSTIVMPEKANPLKVQATRDLGAKVILHGKDFDEAREHVEEIVSREHLRYVHSANEPLLISGVGTLTLEVFEDLPEVDFILAPVGGGSMASGACIVSKALSPKTKIIGVQSKNAPAAYLSWKSKTLVSDKMETFAEGLATRVGFSLTQSILQKHLEEFVLVSDDDIREAMRLMIDYTHTLAEAAGASPLAGALKAKGELKGKNVVLVLTGGNVSLSQLREITNKE